MLPRLNRIKKKKDFETIFKNGKSLKTSLLVFKIIKNGLDYNRFGFVVSQKVSKKAVTRNRIRRILSSVVTSKTGSAKSEGKDIVMVAHPGIEKRKPQEIREILSKHI